MYLVLYYYDQLAIFISVYGVVASSFSFMTYINFMFITSMMPSNNTPSYLLLRCLNMVDYNFAQCRHFSLVLLERIVINNLIPHLLDLCYMGTNFLQDKNTSNT